MLCLVLVGVEMTNLTIWKTLASVTPARRPTSSNPGAFTSYQSVKGDIRERPCTRARSVICELGKSLEEGVDRALSFGFSTFHNTLNHKST